VVVPVDAGLDRLESAGNSIKAHALELMPGGVYLRN
jgi:hypothetical protein